MFTAIQGLKYADDTLLALVTYDLLARLINRPSSEAMTCLPIASRRPGNPT